MRVCNNFRHHVVCVQFAVQCVQSDGTLNKTVTYQGMYHLTGTLDENRIVVIWLVHKINILTVGKYNSAEPRAMMGNVVGMGCIQIKIVPTFLNLVSILWPFEELTIHTWFFLFMFFRLFFSVQLGWPHWIPHMYLSYFMILSDTTRYYRHIFHKHFTAQRHTRSSVTLIVWRIYDRDVQSCHFIVVFQNRMENWISGTNLWTISDLNHDLISGALIRDSNWLTIGLVNWMINWWQVEDVKWSSIKRLVCLC